MEYDSREDDYHQHNTAFQQDVLDAYEEASPTINLIWAQSRSSSGLPAIGFQGGMPWHLSEDLQHFKELTIGHPVIMGRKTWESLGKFAPLPNRDNIVITHDESYRAQGATVVYSLKEAIALASEEAIPDDGMMRDEIWVIGGSQLFTEALPLASRVCVTEIDAEFEADTFAPNMKNFVQDQRWQVLQQSEWFVPKHNDAIARYRFVDYIPVQNIEE